MSKLFIGAILCLLFFSCNSDENSNSPLSGQTYVITSYLLDTAVDFNGDGISSNDLLVETPLFSPLWLGVFNSCLDIGSLRFEEEGIACPFGGGLFIDVEEDDNGELIQTAICAVLSCTGFSEYSINDDRILFSFDNEVFVEGAFLNNTMTFTFPQEGISPFEFLQSDGTIFTYNGSITIVYTLQ